MPVRLRLARTRLTRNSPTFSLVAIPSTSRATARPLEVLGHYDPKPRLEPAPARSPNGQTRDERVWGARQYADNKTGAGVNERVGHKTVSWNVERVKYWLGQGAQPSESVERLLVRAGLLDSQPLQRPGVQPVSRERRIRDAVKAAGIKEAAATSSRSRSGQASEQSAAR